MNTLKLIGAGIAGVVVTLLFSASGVSFGGVYNQVNKYFLDGITVGTTGQFTVSNAGALVSTGDGTISGGTFNVTTSNSATSTIIGGCFQFYATSTATALRFQASTTPGAMVYEYGRCPNL